MRHFRKSMISAGVVAAFACSACVTPVTPGASKTPDSPYKTTGSVNVDGLYGDELSVQATVAAIKSQGTADRISSRAIRLPERPLGEIVVFDYQLPESCGGHEFRVYEIDQTQILEYEYGIQNGTSHTIRDYVNGANPFVRPGLWSAYDHTAGSISSMTSEVEQRGDRLFKGVYSKGLVTNLPDTDQRALGSAYQQALDDAVSCQQMQAVAQVPVE